MTMLKKGAILGWLGALIFLASAGPSLAATVKVTDSNLQPATVTVSRGEEVAWVDATTDQHAHVGLDFRRAAGVRISTGKAGSLLTATFEKPGTYAYTAHVMEGDSHEVRFGLRGKVVVK
jgi:plastocyanin